MPLMVPVSYLARQLRSRAERRALPEQDAAKRDEQADENGGPGLAGLASGLLESKAHVDLGRWVLVKSTRLE